MGYNLYITRGQRAEQDKQRISFDEFFSLIKDDPEFDKSDVLGQVPKAEPAEADAVFVRWIAEDDPSFFVYLFRHGTIHVKSPSNNAIRKMIEMADELNAVVRGESDEIYRLTEGGIESSLDKPAD